MTNNVKIIQSGVWTDQAQQNWCYKPNHARPERYRWKSVQEKTTTQTIKRRVLVETEKESVVSFGYIWPGMRTKAHQPNMCPRDRNLNLHIKMSPNCAAFSVACAPLSVHITPIVMSAPLTAAKARIPCKRIPLSQRHHLPHSCESPWPPTAVLPFSTTSPRYRHPPPTTPTLKMQDERWLCTPSFRPICLELTASPRRKCNNHRYVQVST